MKIADIILTPDEEELFESLPPVDSVALRFWKRIFKSRGIENNDPTKILYVTHPNRNFEVHSTTKKLINPPRKWESKHDFVL